MVKRSETAQATAGEPTLANATRAKPKAARMTTNGPDAEWSLFDALHLRVMSGESGAADLMAVRLVRELRHRLRRILPLEDEELVDTAIDDTVMAYLETPGRYDPERGALMPWLTAITVNRIRDALRSRRRRASHEITCGVDLSTIVQDVGATADEAAAREAWICEHRWVLSRVAQSDGERRLIAARLAGRSLDEQADALGITDGPLCARRRLVGRIWERLRKRLRRGRLH